jgi:hypothetical protein
MPMKQSSFAGVGLNGSDFASHRRLTRKAKFLIEMNEIVPWQVLRIDFLQLWFNLADEACEERGPDATTRLRFRRWLETHALGEAIFARVNALLAERGLKVCSGTMVDATLIAAPSSTKNTDQSRDPKMHQTKRGERREAIKAVAPNAEDFTRERATTERHSGTRITTASLTHPSHVITRMTSRSVEYRWLESNSRWPLARYTLLWARKEPIAARRADLQPVFVGRLALPCLRSTPSPRDQSKHFLHHPALRRVDDANQNRARHDRKKIPP